MWILPLIGYLGLILGFSFLTLAIGTPPLDTISSLKSSVSSASCSILVSLQSLLPLNAELIQAT